MTYSSGSPGGSGYQPGSFGSPARGPSYAAPADPGPSKLPLYLSVGVVVLGLLAYVIAFGPQYSNGTSGGLLLTLATVLAALIAAVGLLPKGKNFPIVVAVLAVLGVFVVLEQVINKPAKVSVGWALWVLLALVILQAIAGVLALLYETGVLTPPAPKPRYESPYGGTPYGQYGQPGQYGGPGGPGGPGSYYNQPPAGGPQGGPPPAPRPAYPAQYGGGYTPPGPSAGSYNPSAPQPAGPQGPPTPPTGYPTFSAPPAVGSGQHHADTNPNLGPVPSPSSEKAPDSSSTVIIGGTDTPDTSGSSGSTGSTSY